MLVLSLRSPRKASMKLTDAHRTVAALACAQIPLRSVTPAKSLISIPEPTVVMLRLLFSPLAPR